jgi:hypothetical protein
MSTERINQINSEIVEIFIAYRETLAKVLPLIEELQSLGVELPPETRKMFRSLTNMR